MTNEIPLISVQMTNHEILNFIDIPGYTTIKEALEECCGVKELKQEDVDEAMKNVELDVSEAIVTSVSKKLSDPEDLAIREIHRNNKGEVKTITYKTDVKRIDSKELWKLKTSGWSMSGKVGVAYQGAAGSATATYHRGKAEAEIQKDTREVSTVYSKDIEMRPRSAYEVTVVKEEATYTANIEKLLLKFPESTTIKTSWRPAKKLSMILKKKRGKGRIINTDGHWITAQINGKFKAKNVTAEVKEFRIS